MRENERNQSNLLTTLPLRKTGVYDLTARDRVTGKSKTYRVRVGYGHCIDLDLDLDSDE